MAKKYRGSSFKRDSMFELHGVSDLLQKIEKAQGNVDDAVKKCADASLAEIGHYMQWFMSEHRLTGDTYNSYEQKPAVVTNGKVTAFVGYNIDKGGLPAIFLDVGTPKQAGKFWRYYAVENSRGSVAEIQRETLNEILRGLQ